MSGSRHPLLGKLLLSATAILLVLAGAEVYHRARAAAKRQSLLAGRRPEELVTRAAPPPLYYDLKPDFPGFTNAQGFRDVPRSVAKPAGRSRIAVVGDSVTMQGELRFDDLYVRQLQRRFDEACAGEVDFLNFGVTGYNTEQEVGLLESRVLPYAPDLVLWQFHDNDAQPSLHSSGFGEFYYRPKSAFFFYVHGKLDNYFCKQKVRGYAEGPLTPDQANLVCRWDEVLGRLAGAVRRLGSLGIPAVVFLYPTWPAGDDWKNYGQAGFDLHRRLSRELQGAGAKVVDLLPVFRDLDPADYRVEPADPWHPNALGHRLIADALFPSLREAVPFGKAICGSAGPAS
jgi:lysophospholipase L1-like esterase